MNWLVYHIVSGDAFFTGIALLIIGAVASTRTRPVFDRIAGVSFLIGVIAVILSSTAIPYWFYAIATVSTLVWIASLYKRPWRRWAPHLTATLWLVAALLEIPFHFLPSLSPISDRHVAILGDSVTAGMGADDPSETWPSLLGRTHHLQVQNLSHVGETAASALKRAKSRQISAPIVIVEIGGNDILGSTSAAQFARDLDALLQHLQAPGRQVVMFELPLPPFCHEYGRAQRRLAAKHHVQLIPKRVFLSVLASGDATLDSIHLSQSGHQLMADSVWRMLRLALHRSGG